MSTDRLPTAPDDRVAATLLALPALLSVLLVLHHPVLHGRHGVADVATGIQALAGMDRIVHGGLIAMLALQTLGFFRFSATLGWGRLAVGAGFLAYAVGVVLMIIPAMLDGFVTPDLAASCLAAAHGCGAADSGAFRLVAAMIQAFTKIALVAMSAGIAGWAIVLLGSPDAVRRRAGAIGLLCAATPVVVLGLADVYLTPAILGGMIAAPVLWNLLAAMVLVRNVRQLPSSGVDAA